jgi:predicted  nucleic acid-binding Zn-ribbon protein
MTSKRKQLHLQDGTDDKLDVVVTADSGASITYDGTKSMTFTAAAFKFRQQGQTQDTDLFGKIAAVEQTINQNLGSNNGAIVNLNNNIDDANRELGEAETDLENKKTAANAKFDANQQKIADEEENRQTALSALDNKFSKDFEGSDDTDPGLLHTLNAEMLTERARVDQETKESDTASEQGDRQKAINDAKSTVETAIQAQKERVDDVAQQLTNLFANIPNDQLKNLANLISDYKAADSSLTNTLSQSRNTLARLRGVIDTTFPPSYDPSPYLPAQLYTLEEQIAYYNLEIRPQKYPLRRLTMRVDPEWNHSSRKGTGYEGMKILLTLSNEHLTERIDEWEFKIVNIGNSNFTFATASGTRLSGNAQFGHDYYPLNTNNVNSRLIYLETDNGIEYYAIMFENDNNILGLRDAFSAVGVDPATTFTIPVAGTGTTPTDADVRAWVVANTDETLSFKWSFDFKSGPYSYNQ